MKLTKLQICNFQSIIKLDLDLHTGINIIVGEGDIGKSAILRALFSWAFNPSGTECIHCGKKSTEVSVTLDSGMIVTWKKIKSGASQYVITDPKGNSKLYEKVGREVPSEVAECIPFIELKIGNENYNLNFANQFDPAFLLSFKPSSRAKLLDSLTGLDILHKALKACNNDSRNDTTKLTTYKELTEHHDVELKKYDWVNAVVVQIEQVAKSIQTTKSLEEKVKVLDNLYEEVKTKQEDLSTVNDTIKCYDGIDSLAEKVSTFVAFYRKFFIIESLYESWVHLTSEATKLKLTIDSYVGLTEINLVELQKTNRIANELSDIYCRHSELTTEVSKLATKIDTYSSLASVDVNKLQKASKIVSELDDIHTEYSNANSSINKINTSKQVTEKTLQDLKATLETLAKSIDVCPVTKKEMPDTCKQAIINRT